MSILAGKLALLVLVPVVGAGVAYPMTTRAGGGHKTIDQIELKGIDDFKSNCWVSIQGDQDDDSSFKKRLLACFVKKNSDGVGFYFYDKDELNNFLPREVTEVKYNGVFQHKHSFTITLVGGAGNATINALNSIWNSVFSEGIARGCKIETSTALGSELLRRLKCNNHRSQQLEEFKVSNT